MVSTKAQDSLLTIREMEVMDLLVTGISNDEIAKKMFVSINTVKTYIKKIRDKLLWGEGHTRTELAVWWVHYKYAILRGAAVTVVNSGVADLDDNIENLRSAVLALAPVVNGSDASE